MEFALDGMKRSPPLPVGVFAPSLDGVFRPGDLLFGVFLPCCVCVPDLFGVLFEVVVEEAAAAAYPLYDMDSLDVLILLFTLCCSEFSSFLCHRGAGPFVNSLSIPKALVRSFT